MIDIKKHPPVLIEWSDARGGYAEWHYKDEGCLTAGLSNIFTMGFLFNKTKDSYTVVMNVGDYDEDTEQYCCIMHIPRKAVKRIIKVRLDREQK